MADQKRSLLYKLGLNTQNFQKGLKKAGQTSQAFGKKAQGTFSKLAKRIKESFIGVTALIGVLWKLWSSINNGAKLARNMEKAFAEVNTLYSGPGGLTESTKQAIVAQSRLYGTDVIKNIRGFYDIVSSGITEQTKALDVLNASNKLAKVGMTEVSTAADALTGVLNAYGHETYTASKASDILFKTVQLGKTTMPELAQNIGQVLGIAAQAGLSFEELGAAIATMTAQSVKTPETMTALKGVLTSLIRKEGPEAKEITDKLGYSWSIASLKAHGLVKMMTDLKGVIGDNKDQIAKLSPNIRAMLGAFALIANDGKNFVSNMNQMKDVLGTVDGEMKDVKKSIDDILRVQENMIALDMAELFGGLNGLKVVLNDLLLVTLKVGKAMKWLFTIGHKIPGNLGDALNFRPFDKRSYSKKGRKDIAVEQEAKSTAIADAPAADMQKAIESSVEKQQKMYEKIRDMAVTMIKKVEEGVIRIRKQAEDAILKIKMSLKGADLADINRAMASLKTGGARGIFNELRGQTGRLKSGKDIAILAEAAQKLAGASGSQKSVFDNLVNTLKEFKGEVSASDILESVKVSIEGLNQGFQQTLSELIKTKEGEIKDIEAEARRKELEFIRDASKNFGQAVEKFIKDQTKTNEDFQRNMQEFGKTAKLFNEASKKIEEASRKPIVLKLRGDLSKVVESSIERSKQNSTLNNQAF